MKLFNRAAPADVVAEPALDDSAPASSEPVPAPVPAVEDVAPVPVSDEQPDPGFYTDSKGVLWQHSDAGWSRPGHDESPAAPDNFIPISNAEAAALLSALEPIEEVAL